MLQGLEAGQRLAELAPGACVGDGVGKQVARDANRLGGQGGDRPVENFIHQRSSCSWFEQQSFIRQLHTLENQIRSATPIDGGIVEGAEARGLALDQEHG
ncbi:MAG: hypothetical protein ABSD80_13325 [Caulobacteraceae bacterium]